jgi:hypothetical protein
MDHRVPFGKLSSYLQNERFDGSTAHRTLTAVVALPVRAAYPVVAVMTLWIPANSPHPASDPVYAVTG